MGYWTHDKDLLLNHWDHLATKRKGSEWFVIFYTDDKREIPYGPYKNVSEAHKAMEEIVDENVSLKFPFLDEPMKEMDVDAAARLMAGVIADARMSYIARAIKLKKMGQRIPTSVKEYQESGLSKKIFNEINRLKESKKFLDKEQDKERIEKIDNEIANLEKNISGLYDTIKFVEEGCHGALGILHSGISGQEILKEWKNEALGYRR